MKKLSPSVSLQDCKQKGRISMVDTKMIEEAQKTRCRSQTIKLILDGKLKREKCFCGAKGEAHHDDYHKPEQITWLCKKHHPEADAKRRIKDAKEDVLNSYLIQYQKDHKKGIVTKDDVVTFLSRNDLGNYPFTSTEIEKLNLFFWTKDSRQRVNVINRDMFATNILRADIKGEGRRRRYKILGKNIIKFIEKYGDTFSFLESPRKQKNSWDKKRERKQR